MDNDFTFIEKAESSIHYSRYKGIKLVRDSMYLPTGRGTPKNIVYTFYRMSSEYWPYFSASEAKTNLLIEEITHETVKHWLLCQRKKKPILPGQQ